jgi:hypothetical protein
MRKRTLFLRWTSPWSGLSRRPGLAAAGVAVALVPEGMTTVTTCVVEARVRESLVVAGGKDLVEASTSGGEVREAGVRRAATREIWYVSVKSS